MPLSEPSALLADRGAGGRHCAEDLERDRQVVRSVDPDRVHVVEAVAPRDPRRPQADHAPSSPERAISRQRFDSRVVAPLVHHEQAAVLDRRQPLGLGDVGGQRLLDEDRDPATEKSLGDRRMRDRGRGDDRAVDLRQLLHRRDDARRPALLRATAALRRTGDYVHLATEHAEVAQDVPAPLTAACKPDLLVNTFWNGRPHPLSVHHGEKAGAAGRAILEQFRPSSTRSCSQPTGAAIPRSSTSAPTSPTSASSSTLRRSTAAWAGCTHSARRLDPPLRRRRGPEPEAPREPPRADRPARAHAIRDAAPLALRIDGVLDLAVAVDARLPVPPRPERPRGWRFPAVIAQLRSRSSAS